MSEEGKVDYALAHFNGHVQGVGFRYSCLQIAKGYEVTGYVRNLVDGRVELIAEGSAKEVDAFIAAIMHQMDSYVRKLERKDGRRPREFSSFNIL